MAYPQKVLHALRRQNPRAAYRLSQLGESAFCDCPVQLLDNTSPVDLALTALSPVNRLPEGYRDDLITICRQRQIPLGGLLSPPDISRPEGDIKQHLATTPVPAELSSEMLRSTLDFSQQLAMKKNSNATYLLRYYDMLAQALLALNEQDYARILADPDVTAIRVGKATVVAVSSDAQSRYTSARLAQAATVSPDAPVMVTADRFEAGKLAIYYQHGDWVGTGPDNPMPIHPHLVVETMSLRYHDPRYGDSLNLEGTDQTLSDPEYFDAFLRTVAKYTDRHNQAQTPDYVRMQLHDLRSIAALHQVQREIDTPVTQTIYPALHLPDTTRVVARIGDASRQVTDVRQLADLTGTQSITLYFGASEQDSVKFTCANRALLRRGLRNFALHPAPEGGYVAAGAQQQFTLTLSVPLQTRQQKAAIKHFIDQSRHHRRYMTQSFDEQGLRRESGPVAAGDTWFTPGTQALLAHHQAKGIAALEIIKDPVHNDRPVYVSINVYTPTKNGWNIRRSQQVITDNKEPSQGVLERLGMDVTEYEIFADLAISADHRLSRVFDGQGQYLVMFPGTPTGLDALSAHLPKLAEHVRRSPHVMMQTYQKQALLACDGRDTITLYPGHHGHLPARFHAQTVSELLEDRDCHKRASLCGHFLLEKNGDTVVLKDLSRHTSSDMGNLADMRKRLWKSRTAPGSQDVSGSERRLVSYSLARQTLRASAPAIQNAWQPIPYTDALKLADKDTALVLDDKVQKAFTQMMTRSSYDFSLSPTQNAMAMADNNDIAWQTPVMGGLGGKAGRQLLQDIKKADPRFFDQVMAGRGLSEYQMLSDKHIPRNLKAATTITYGDVLTYCCTQYEAAYPAQKKHYAPLRWLPAFIEFCPPSFREHPKARFDTFFSSYGIDPQVALKLYDQLYQQQKQTPRAFERLYQDNTPAILSTQSLQRDRAFISQLTSTPTPDGLSHTLNAHIQSNRFRQTLKTLPMLPDTLHVTEHPALSDMRKVMISAVPVNLSAEQIDKLVAGIKVLNSAPELNDVNRHLDPPDRHHSDEALARRLEAITQYLNGYVSSLPSAAIIASPSGVREHIEALLIDACDDTHQAPYNTAIPPVVLDHVQDTLTPHLSAMGVSDNAATRFASSMKRARHQFAAMQAIEQLRLDDAGIPVLRDDRLSRLKDVEGWHRRMGNTPRPMRFAEALTLLADATHNSLPDATRQALKRHAREDKAPSRHSLAYQVEQQMKRLFRQSLPPVTEHRVLRQLAAQSHLSTRTPVSTMANLALLRPAPTEKPPVRAVTNPPPALK